VRSTAATVIVGTGRQPTRQEKTRLSARARLCRNLERLSAADYQSLLRSSGEDVRLRFPGDNSWAVELQGKSELESWLQSFVAIGLRVVAEEAVATGPPWRRTIVVSGATDLKTPAGDTVYANRYVMWARAAWGRCLEYEVYEDTQRTAALDEYLAAHERWRSTIE
jgi:ketosteroid isomerase-like protein